MISTRHVFFLAGYDPIDLSSQHKRFRREVAKFEKTWSISANVSDTEAAESGARWSVTTRGPGWTTSTVFEPLDWHDVVAADLARPAIPRLFDGFVAFLDFLFSGAAARYFTASWRYGLFFLMPFFYLLMFAAVGIGAGVALASLAKAGMFAGVAITVVVALIVFALLRIWPGRRWRIDQALADWIFARDFMLGRRKDVEQRLDGFAQRIVAAARANSADEILIVGHSLGATMAVEVIARALDQDPALASHGPVVSLLTVGATIPKIALHPAGIQLRAGMARIAAEPGIFWTEYQARRDPISFYKYDPAALHAFQSNAKGQKPHICLVGLKDMLAPETFAHHKLNHMRLHYQFVMANERRALYDYFMLLLGPAPFEYLSTIPGGALDGYGEDGSYRGPGKGN
jgi:pimeloyl-ACP methyl ester carboxylesterase